MTRSALPGAAAVPPDHEAVLEPPVVVQAPELAPALLAWQQRLAAAGLACRAVALYSPDPAWCADFSAPAASAADPCAPARAAAADRPPAGAWADTWAGLRVRVSRQQPVALAKLEGSTDLMVATSLTLPDGRAGIVGAVLGPPHNDRSLQLLLLALGWLQLTLAAASLAHNQRAAELLTLVGHVSSHEEARAGAQDWINRTAAWARAQGEAGAEPAGDAAVTDLQLTLFEVRGERLRWWVSADASQVETGAPALQAALDAGQRAYVQGHELALPGAWALPLFDQGEVVAVLVARASALPEAARQVLRTSAVVIEPLLRHWRDAQRSWPGQTLAALRRVQRRLFGPGHRLWKAGALALLAAGAVLLLWPVDDRVTANAVIEGRTRQLVTAPFEGFVAEPLVRPGDRVQQGQSLLRLDTRELVLEQARLRGELDQAAGRLRQAMADREAAAVALATAEVAAAQGQLSQVDGKLARAELRAPMDGQIVSGDWTQQVGAPVALGKELFELASADGWRVVLHVDERDINRLRSGQTGELRLAGQPQDLHALQVNRITATASLQDGVNGFRVEAQWVGDAPALSPGMQGVAKVTVGQSHLLDIWTRSTRHWLRLKLWTWWW